jgi:hypothetical protein
MEANIEPSSEQGLLDLTVELSTSDVTAGNEFAIFVLVKNPFSKSVWIREVNVSLPSELIRVDAEKIQEKIKENEENRKKQLDENKQERIQLKEKIDNLQHQIDELTQVLKSRNGDSETISTLVFHLENELDTFREKLQLLNLGMSSVQIFKGAQVEVLKINSQSSEVQIYDVAKGTSDNRPTRVQQIEINEPWLVYEQQAQERIVKLKSSLPNNSALQSGSTAVYTVVLNVKRSLIFTPSKYRLQFYVNYSFIKPNETDNETVLEKIYTNTLAHSLAIRPSVYSVLIGSIIGGMIGAIARLLQSPTIPSLQGTIVSLFLSIILGGMAVIFMARKSDAQSFVSVEDFWGGILIGFLVGYTGTSFFQSITGIQVP